MKVSHRVLGIHFFPRGFGWIVLEGSSTPIDWGVVERKKDRNTQSLFAVERILERNRPQAVVLEAFEEPIARRTERVRSLCRSVVAVTQARNIKVRIYSRMEIAQAFPGHASRYAIAATIAHRIEPIRHRLPKKRALWESEKPNMALFNAAATALTYYIHNCRSGPP